MNIKMRKACCDRKDWLQALRHLHKYVKKWTFHSISYTLISSIPRYKMVNDWSTSDQPNRIKFYVT